MSYLFVSHASRDNARLKPVVEAALNSGLALWFDRPYELGLPTSRFVGYIREGESWTMEILQAMVDASGVLCFPSRASAASDECRLELALGRVFGAVCDFKTFPVLLDEESHEHLDHRISNVQGRRIRVERELGEIAFRLEVGSQASMKELATSMKNHASRFSSSGGIMRALLDRFASARSAMTQPSATLGMGNAAQLPIEFERWVLAYREADDWQARRAIDDRVARSRRNYPLAHLLSPLEANPDEAVEMAAAMSLAVSHADDSADCVSQTAVKLLRSGSERVRFRVGDALSRRVRARLVHGSERNELLCVLEPSIALERHAEVGRALKDARDAVAATPSMGSA